MVTLNYMKLVNHTVSDKDKIFCFSLKFIMTYGNPGGLLDVSYKLHIYVEIAIVNMLIVLVL